jgi:signal transduction histidine kinase
MLPRPSASDPFSFVPAGGETAALLRSLDWSQSPLGPPERWSRTLKTTLGILFHSRQPMFLFWGPELIQFYNDGYLPSIGNGKHPSAMGQRGPECWPEIWHELEPQIRAVMTRGEASWNEDQLLPIYRHGRLEDTYWTYSYSPVFDEDGSVAGTLVVSSETTAKVLNQREVERRRREAELSREELNGIFRQTPLPMCILSGPDHVFTLANPRYQELVGREVLGRPFTECFSDEEIALYLPQVNRVLETGEPALQREALLQLKDAQGHVEDRYIDVGYHPYRDAAGVPRGVLVLIQDVTEPVLARRRKERMTEELQAAVRARDEFLSLASHELRTPLTGMKLRLEIARRSLQRGGATEGLLGYLEQSGQGLTRLTRLVEDMLDISRIQSGKLQLRLERVDLAALVRETVERFAPQLAEAAIAYRVEAPAAVELEVDRFRIEQVLLNLLTNAIRYAPGAPLQVSVLTAPSSATLVFEDSGPGIAREHHARVFERYERLNPGDHGGGLGLGLFIAQEIVRAHGGHIHLDSEPGRGTRFAIELPLHPGA